MSEAELRLVKAAKNCTIYSAQRKFLVGKF